MSRAKFVALVLLSASAVVQANQCLCDGECPNEREPRNGVLLLQTKLQTNVSEDSVVSFGRSQLIGSWIGALQTGNIWFAGYPFAEELLRRSLEVGRTSDAAARIALREYSSDKKADAKDILFFGVKSGLCSRFAKSFPGRIVFLNGESSCEEFSTARESDILTGVHCDNFPGTYWDLPHGVILLFSGHSPLFAKYDVGRLNPSRLQGKSLVSLVPSFTEGKKERPQGFLAYANSECVAARENVYREIKRYCISQNLPSPSSLGSCSGGGAATKRTHGSGDWQSNPELFSGYRFAFVAEHSSSPGYLTEKLVNGLFATTVPIYWGDQELAEKWFNKERWIWVDPENPDKALASIQELEQNSTAWWEKVEAPIIRPDQLSLWQDISAEVLHLAGLEQTKTHL